MSTGFLAVLDTSAVRSHLCYPSEPKLDISQLRGSRDEVRLAVADIAAAELTHDLVTGVIRWHDWKPGVRALAPLMHFEHPILPGGKELAALAGLHGRAELTFDTRRFQREFWKIVANSENLRMLERKLRDRTVPAEGRETPKERIDRVLEEGRIQWAENIKEIQELIAEAGESPNPAQEALIGAILMGLKARKGEAPDFPDKLEAMGRVLGRVMHLATKKKDAYNPLSRKRRNDGLDFTMLLALALENTVLITGDGGITTHLRESGSPSAQRVLTVVEFNQHIRGKTLGTLF